MLTKYVMFTRAHEFLVVMLSIVGVGWHLGAKYEDNQEAKIIAGQTLVQVQTDQKDQIAINQVLAGQLADQEAASYARLAAQIRRQNAKIDAEMMTLKTIKTAVDGHLSISGPGVAVPQ